MKPGKLLYTDKEAKPDKFTMVLSVPEEGRVNLDLDLDEVLTCISTMASWVRIHLRGV